MLGGRFEVICSEMKIGSTSFDESNWTTFR